MKQRIGTGRAGVSTSPYSRAAATKCAARAVKPRLEILK
jgi:hypothetical protein